MVTGPLERSPEIVNMGFSTDIHPERDDWEWSVEVSGCADDLASEANLELFVSLDTSRCLL